MSKKGKDDACGKTTKDTVRRETSTSCKGRSTGKKIEEDRGRRGSMCDQVMRGATRVEEEFSSRVEEENRGALQQGGTRRNTPTGVRMVHERSNSDIHTV